MKSWNKKQTFHNISWGECILTGLLALIVLATVLFPITDLDQITTLGNEIQYWGGTMSFLGQDWSHYIDGQAMISYGYSLILLPICMIFKNATFAYKAAIILNGCFLTMAYLVAVKTTKRLFENWKGYATIFSSFIIFLLPIYGESRTTVGPQALMILLFWLSVYFVCGFQKEKNRRNMVLLGICIIFLTWLDITMLAVVAGTATYLYYCVKKEQLSEDAFLKWTLLVLAGFCAGYAAEQLWLYRMYGAAGVSYSGSMQLLLSNIISNWNNEGIFGVAGAVLGKTYALVINTFGLLLAAIYFVIKSWKKENEGESFQVYITVNVLFLFVLNALYKMGITESVCRETLMTEMLVVVIGPFLLFAVKQISVSSEWIKESIGYVFALLGLTLTASHLFKDIISVVVDASFGIFNYAYQKTNTSQGMIYYSTAVVIIVFLLLNGIMRFRTKWEKVNSLCVGMGLLMCTVISVYFVQKNVTYVVERHSDSTKYQQVADVLNAVGGKMYVKEEDASLKAHIPVIQMLSNRCNIILAEEDKTAEEEMPVYITSSPYYKWEEKLEGYEANCQVKGVIIWSPKGSEVQEKVDEFLTQKEYRASRVKGGKNSIYGEKLTLSPGVYTAKFSVKIKKLKGNGEEKIEFGVKSESNVLQSKTYLAKELKTGEDLNIELLFGSDDFIGNCKFYIKRDSDVKLTVDKVSYQKARETYSFGMNAQEEMQKLHTFMESVNQEVGKDGTLAYYEEGAKIPSKDYVICNADLSVCFDLLKKYTILQRNDAYALLALTGSKYDEKGTKINGFVGSKKKEINLKTILEPHEDGTYYLEDSFQLKSGDYRITLRLKLLSKKKKQEILGVYRLMNGEERLAGKKIQAKFFENDICEISLPLVLYSDCSNIRYTISPLEEAEIEVLDASIKMNSKKYKIGSEKNLSAFANIVNKTDKKADVYYYTDRKSITAETYSLDYLQSLMPKCTLDMRTYDDVMEEQGDIFLITRGYSTKYFRLVSQYTMIAQRGQYVLWVKSDGGHIISAMKYGATMLSQGNKISAELLAELQNREYDGTVSNLPDGTYQFSMRAEIENAVEDDTIEVSMMRDMTKQELQEEKEVWKANGYTDGQMEEFMDTEISTEPEEYIFDGLLDGTKIVTYQMDCESDYRHIRPMLYSWKGSCVEGEILWVELIR